jgi:adenylate kinase family enzyme
MPPVVVIVGPPGSGKSTAARAVAARTGLASRDTDEDRRGPHRVADR